MGVGEWQSLEASPYDHASSNYDPIFWFPAINVSGVAINIEALSQLPEILNGLPNEEVQRKQSALAEAQPLFRYRSASDDTSLCRLSLPGKQSRAKHVRHIKWTLQTFL